MQGALHLSRRQSLQGLVVLGAGAALSGIARPSPVLAQDISDEDIFRFALNLEYM
ncbi:MAG: ferritin-like domain-containing protein, partial [Mesorhizobium sp.]